MRCLSRDTIVKHLCGQAQSLDSDPPTFEGVSSTRNPVEYIVCSDFACCRARNRYRLHEMLRGLRDIRNGGQYGQH